MRRVVRGPSWPLGLISVAVVAALAAPMTHASVPSDTHAPLPVPSATALSESVVPLSLEVGVIELLTDPLEVETTDGAEQVLTLNSDILFAFDKAVIPDNARAKIGELVAELPQKAKVGVGGHTDSLGTAARNRALSQQRAAAVAAVVTAARPDLVLTVKGFGSADPVAPNSSGGKDDPEARAKNRRVELRYAG